MLYSPLLNRISTDNEKQHRSIGHEPLSQWENSDCEATGTRFSPSITMQSNRGKQKKERKKERMMIRRMEEQLGWKKRRKMRRKKKPMERQRKKNNEMMKRTTMKGKRKQRSSGVVLMKWKTRMDVLFPLRVLFCSSILCISPPPVFLGFLHGSAGVFSFADWCETDLPLLLLFILSRSGYRSFSAFCFLPGFFLLSASLALFITIIIIMLLSVLLLSFLLWLLSGWVKQRTK